ncbi:MAG: Gfo/Idh/MocA family oxidoreductase [Alphaproteobacteria bacterium]|nr:Gfo/Idh/MocA family oxidoreductase [Alphaproteobacteria bacterium]
MTTNRDGLRFVIAGLGVQGAKRRHVAGGQCVATVDPVHEEADFRSLESVRADRYDAAILCVPDGEKKALIDRLVDGGKHVLVEKPMPLDAAWLTDLERRARARSVVVQCAYNHRFEPHIAAVRGLLAEGRVGRPLAMRLFYGNGTVRLVRDSPWRDQGAGIIHDLGSHLIDIVHFWFGGIGDRLDPVAIDRFEARAPDHARLVLQGCDVHPAVMMEMSYLSWRNSFAAEIWGDAGSVHIDGLCKWGPSRLTVRERVLPAGRPPEWTEERVQADPTWHLEFDDFQHRIASGVSTDLSRDRDIAAVLGTAEKEMGP